MRAEENNLFNHPNMQQLAKRSNGEKTWIEAQEEKGRKEKINFINLLATQLKNQLPTDPVNVNEITQQIVSMNIFEQNLETNKLLSVGNRYGEFAYKQAMLNLLDGSKEVKVESDVFGLTAEGADIYYELPAESKETKLSIFDGRNQKVKEIMGEKTAGLHQLQWNGMDEFGNKVPIGTYKLVINAVDVDDQIIAAKAFSRGKIKGAAFGKGQDDAYVEVNGANIPLSKVTQVWAGIDKPVSLPLSEDILKKLQEADKL